MVSVANFGLCGCRFESCWDSGLRNQRLGGNSVDPNEVAHYEPPHLGLQCLRIQLHIFSVFGTLCVSLTLFWWPTLNSCYGV